MAISVNVVAFVAQFCDETCRRIALFTERLSADARLAFGVSNTVSSSEHAWASRND